MIANHKRRNRIKAWLLIGAMGAQVFAVVTLAVTIALVVRGTKLLRLGTRPAPVPKPPVIAPNLRPFRAEAQALEMRNAFTDAG